MTRRDRLRSSSSVPTRYPFGKLWDAFERRILMPYIVLMCGWFLYSVLAGLRG